MTNINRDLRDLESIRQGDAEAFARIYKSYWERVYGFAFRMLGKQTTAEDITHEVFLVIIQKPESYKSERGSLNTFLCAIARNQILNHFRRQGVEINDSFDEESPILSVTEDGGKNPLSSLLEKELAEKVNKAIALLPVLQREVIILREFQDLSYKEISIVTDEKVGVIKARLYRARQTLAKKLAGYMKSKGENYYELRRN
jgi:RNA polymerase sigma-70 factor, ECF subfamily